MTKVPLGGEDDDVCLTAEQERAAARDAKRQAKDQALQDRLASQRTQDDEQHWHGRHIVDTAGLAQVFPDPETPEYSSGTIRRRITHGVILVLLLALVVTGLVLAGMIQRGELELKVAASKPTPSAATCPAQIINFTANASISVNVFNAGGSEGKAGKVAAELTQRGYQVKTVANGSTQYTAPVVLVSGTLGESAAFNLQRNVDGSEYVHDDRKDATVDFIITDAYQALVVSEKIDQTPGLLSCPRLSPTPEPSAPATP